MPDVTELVAAIDRGDPPAAEEPLPPVRAPPAAPGDDRLALDEALSELERHDEPAARLVKLRYFAGLSHQEAAAAMDISRGAADRLWALARAWLYRRLND